MKNWLNLYNNSVIVTGGSSEIGNAIINEGFTYNILESKTRGYNICGAQIK